LETQKENLGMAATEVKNRDERQLIEVWLLANDGRASQEELSWLNRHLGCSSDARQSILSLSQHQGWLAWQGGPTPSMAAARCELGPGLRPTVKSRLLRSWREQARGWAGKLLRTRLFSARGLAAVACLCLVVGSLWQQVLIQSSAVTDVGILEARIVGGTPCVWDSAGIQHLDRNKPLREGDSLQLLEGIAELSLQHHGTPGELVMEGPAAVLLARQAVPTLRYGKITIKTDAEASERFPIETPFGRVMVESGTEVGISVFGGSAQVHVFTGVATVESPWLISPPQGVESRIVSAGEALFFEGVGNVTINVTEGQAHRDRFTPQVSMQSDFLAVDAEYVNEIKESGPVAYWRFEQDRRRVDSAGEVVVNEIADRFNGRIRGKVRWVGPVGNQAIEFGLSPEPGSMVVDQSWDEVLDGDYSMEAWIKPSHYHLGSILGFIGEFDWKDHRNKHGLLLEVGGTSQPSSIHRPERIRFLHRPILGVQGGAQCFSDRSYCTRKWQHVVALREGADLRLYLDGELVANNKDSSNMPLGLQLVLGQLYSETVERFFIGHVDEVAIYDRALQGEEVRRHHELLRPRRKSPGEQEAERRVAHSPVMSGNIDRLALSNIGIKVDN
jgi:hypothetical protein